MQNAYYVVQMTTRFRSLAEARASHGEAMAAHVARSKELHEQGVLVMAGAFLEPSDGPVQTMGVLTSREAADDYARNDPFVVAGLVEQYTIRQWANLFGA
jgi:uncharacterized protein YciI